MSPGGRLGAQRRARVGAALLFAVEGAMRVGTASSLLQPGDAAAAVLELIDVLESPDA